MGREPQMVIVVKTKRGSRNQDAQFTYSGTFGTSSAVKLPELNYDPVYNMEFKNLTEQIFVESRFTQMHELLKLVHKIIGGVIQLTT